MREFNSTDENDHKQQFQKYSKRLEMQHLNLVKLIKCFNKIDTQFCSTFFKTYLLFEYVSNSLEKEIITRRNAGTPDQYFQESEIWNTMGGII